MPGSMDERVVSMEFDNKKFEKNVKTSIKTLDDLKESLDFDKSADSLETLDKKFKTFGRNNAFDDVNKSCTALQKGMGLLGNSAGSLVGQFAQITKITAMFAMAERAVRSLENSIKQFTIQPITQGFEKYTTKINSVKTIANATGMSAEAVDKSLDRLNWFTDETSASFSEMVNNIGKFTSVGKGLDESITAMQGIAAWGYHSGASVVEQTRAMYNLSQALGTGSVKLIDWKSIENAGMATKEFKEQAIAAAEAAGTLKRKGDKLFTTGGGKSEEVTVENFNSTLAKGWFSSDVLMATLEEYGSFADKVRKYQEEHPQYALASEAMEAMDEERLKKQNDIYEKYLDSWSKNAEKSTSAIKNDIERINKIANPKEREKEVKAFAKSVGMSYEETLKILDELADCEESLGEKAFKSSQQAKSFAEAIDATKDAVSTGWMKTFQYIFGGLDKSIELWSDVTEILWDLFAAGAEFRNNAFLHWAEEFNGWADLWNANEDNGPIGALRNIMDSIITLKDLMGESVKDVFFPQLARITGDINGEQDAKLMAKNGLKTTDQLKNWREGNFMGSQLKQMTSNFRKFTAAINEFFTNDDNVEKFRNIFTAVATAIQFAGNVIGGFFGAIGSFVRESGIFQDILNVLSRVSVKITEIFNKLQTSGFIQKLFGRISSNFVWFYNLFKGWINAIREFFDETGLTKSIKDWFNGILEFFTGSEKDVDEEGKRTEAGFFRAFGWLSKVKEWLGNLDLKVALYNIKDVIDNFGEIWAAFTVSLTGKGLNKKSLKNSGLSENLQNIIEKVWAFGNKLSGAWEFVKGIYDSVVGWLESSGILPAIREFADTISIIFKNIGTVWQIFTDVLSGKSPMEAMMKHMTKASGGATKLTKTQKVFMKVAGFAEKLRGIYAKFKTWFGMAIDWFGEKWEKIKAWLESSGVLPTIRGWWQGIKDFFANIGLIWDYFIKGNKNIDPSKMSEGQLSILAKIEEFVTKIRSFFARIVGWLESSGILPAIRSVWGWIQELFGNIALLWDYFVNGNKDISGKDLSEDQINMLGKVEDFIHRVGDWIDRIKEWFDKSGISGAWESVKGFFSNLWGDIAGIFGGGEAKNVELPAVSGTSGGGGGSASVVEKKPGFFDKVLDGITTDGAFDPIKAISTGAVGILELIASIDWTGMSTNIFGVVVDIVNGFNDALGKLRYDNILRVMGDVIGKFTLLFVGGGILELINSIRAIMTKGKAGSIFGDFSKVIESLGTMMLQIGISIALIAGAMWVISKIKKDDFGRTVGVLVGIGVFMAGIIILGALIGKHTGADNKTLAAKFKAIGSMLLMIGISVALIAASIWLISKMKPEQLTRGLEVVGGILVAMVVLLVAISWFTKNSSGSLKLAGSLATFAGLAIVLVAVTVCVLLLQNIKDPVKAVVSAIILAGFLFAIAGAIKLMDKVKITSKTLGTMIIMAVLIGLVTAAIILMKDMDLGQALGSVGIIVGALFSMVIIAMLLSKMPDGAIKGAAIFAAVLAILVGTISILALVVSMVAGTVMNNLVSVMSSLATMSISAKLVDKEAIQNALDTLVIICAGFANVNYDADGLTNALAVADAAWTLFNRLKLATMSAKLVEKEQFVKIFGEDGTGGLLQIIQTGLSSVTNTGYKAASLGTHVEQLAESLKLVGQAGLMLGKDLEDYSGQTYEQGIQNVKDRLTDIQTIVEMATTMGTTGSGDDIKQIDLTTFSEGIANIGAALQLYNEALKSFETEGANGTEALSESDVAPISTENISAALQSVMGALRGVTFDSSEVSAIEGWAGLTSGGDGGTLFALGLTNIANAMGTFSTAAKDFDNNNVKTAIESLGTLADIKAKVENPEQYKSTIDGITAWGDSGEPEHQGSFANAISSMGTAMAAFGQSVKDMPAGSVRRATNALDTLATIYEKLKGKEDMVSSVTTTLSTWFGEVSQTTEYTDSETPSGTFHDFSEGIGYLGDALAAFSTALTSDEIKYDETKVSNATSILEAMVEMQKSLVEMKSGQGWFDKALFGENGFKKLGDHISGLGARLATFANELTGAGEDGKAFDLDIDSKQWKNVSGVLTYLVGLATELNNLSYYVEEFDEQGQTVSADSKVGHTLANLADWTKKIIDAVVEFNDKMQTIRTVKGGASTNTYKLGEWAESNWSNIMSMLNQLKDLSIEFGNSGIQEGKFYDLDKFAFDIKQLINDLNASNVSELMNKVASENSGINTGAFVEFVGSIKTLAEATGILHSTSVSEEDVLAMGTLLQAFANLDTSNFDPSKFALNGTALAGEFISGLVAGLTQAEGEGGNSLFDTLLAVITEYSQSFYDAGKTAGEMYANGFKEGFGSFGPTGGSLAPVVSMGVAGETATPTGLTAILATMNYPTIDHANTIITHLETIKGKFDNPINVDDGHADITNAIGSANDKLEIIKTDIGKLEGDIANLKVFINPDLLVGAIADKMDRALGAASRVGP